MEKMESLQAFAERDQRVAELATELTSLVTELAYAIVKREEAVDGRSQQYWSQQAGYASDQLRECLERALLASPSLPLPPG